MKKKDYKAFTLHNYRNIPQIASLSAADKETIEVIGKVLPFKTNNYVVEELIDWNNIAADPVFTLNFPRREMLLPEQYEKAKELLRQNLDTKSLQHEINKIRTELNPNPAGQEHNVPIFNRHKLFGIQHKYRETILLFPRQGQTCHAYCTFCFRWPQFSGLDGKKFVMKDMFEVYNAYLAAHPRITDALFTGGDPMTMHVKFLKPYIEQLLNSEQIRSIRIGTKSLAYWPYRFLTDDDSDEIMRLFERVVKSGKNLAIMAHFNHPVELSTPAVQKAIARIRSTGAQIRTQSPVLRHINDDPALWAQMWRMQVNLNCIPYYMFIARDTGAKHYFELPLEQCWNIFRMAYQQVSGICRTVRGPSMSANPGKIQVLGVGEIKGEKVFVLRFIQGRNPDWAARPFFAKYNPDATWFDELEPAFDEKKFFFEDELAQYLQDKPEYIAE